MPNFEHSSPKSLVDVGILTVIRPELAAARDALGKLQRKKEGPDGTVYWHGAVPSALRKRNYSVVLAGIGMAGNSPAAAAATRMIERFRPSVMLLVGIAAGIRDKVRIGDVVLSERVVAYESAAVVAHKDRPPSVERRPEISRVPMSILQDVLNYEIDPARLAERFASIKGVFPAPPPGREAEWVHVAREMKCHPNVTIASGEKLLRDPGVLLEFRQNVHGKIEVGEMEAAGFADACEAASVGWLVVRGISDFGDDLKDDRFHELASKTAAVVAADFIENALDLPNEPTPGAAARALDGLAKRLGDRTGSELISTGDGPAVRLSVDRGATRDSLVAELRTSVQQQKALIVTGEPDVGKSALTLAAVEVLRADGAVVIALSLRDLPSTFIEIESLLDASLGDVLNSTAAPVRFLVLDGAEIVLEGRAEILREFAHAALGAGFAIVAVTRDDAYSAVEEVIVSACKRTGMAEDPKVPSFAVPSFTDTQIESIVETFAPLRRIATEPRSRWLLGRPGLVKLLLRSDAYAALPDGALSEADVFAAVWARLVRHSEMRPEGGATPDGRESALLALARKLLLPEAPQEVVTDAQALGSLRSDGLLLSSGTTVAWNKGDEFANDLVRDLAVARLLVRSPFNLLAQAGAPRWTVRAARLACQARLLQSNRSVESIRVVEQVSFDALAEAHGDRWSDLPWEALLTLGAPDGALSGAWPSLVADGGSGLARVLRLIDQRYTRARASDVVLTAPVVALLCEHAIPIRALPSKVSDAVDRAILSWLSGFVLRGKADVSNALRVRVREVLLDRARMKLDDVTIECLAMLGPDTDQRVEAVLRDRAEQSPSDLDSCVETLYSPFALAVHRPQVLVALSKAYYIEQPEPPSFPWGFGARSHGDGIRRHRRTGGVLSAMAAWYYGPFWPLLLNQPKEALKLINGILDHAARYRVTEGAFDVAVTENDSIPGLDIDLPGMGPRHYVGDRAVWHWYRGSSRGPYPCVSALLAVERLADQMVAAGAPLAKVIQFLLADCHNLAMPGLVVGLLVRHIDRIENELDPWLSEPDVWQLELDRASHEGRFHIQGKDDAQVVGADRRVWSFEEVAITLVAGALRRNDSARQIRLGELSKQLIERSQSAFGPVAKTPASISDESAFDIEEGPSPDVGDASVGDAESASIGRDAEARWLLIARGWAGWLDVRNYQGSLLQDGRFEVIYNPPQDVAKGLEALSEKHALNRHAWRLVSLYGLRDPSSWPRGAQFLADLTIARSLDSHPPVDGPPDKFQAPAAAAAAALITYAAGHMTLLREDLLWAVDLLLRVAMRAEEALLPSEDAVYPMGADRFAARALPVLMLPIFADVLSSTDQLSSSADARVVTRGPQSGSRISLWFSQIRRCLASLFRKKSQSDVSPPDTVAARVHVALRALACGKSIEVRRILAVAMTSIWEAPCTPGRGGTPKCLHFRALGIIWQSAGECHVGNRNVTTGLRSIGRLKDPVETSFTSVSAEELSIDHLTGAIAATTACAAANCCASPEAARQREILLAADRRGVVWRADGNYQTNDENRQLVARTLLTAGTEAPLLAHVKAFVGHWSALAELLTDLAVVSTYDMKCRIALRGVWSMIMEVVLNTTADTRNPRQDDSWRRRAMGALLPRPTPSPTERDVAKALEDARIGWPKAEDLSSNIERWLVPAAGYAECVDALVGLLAYSPMSVQLSAGLKWVDALVGPHFDQIAEHSLLLPEWLESLQDSGNMSEQSLSMHRRLVDGLVAANDSRLVRVQMRDEE